MDWAKPYSKYIANKCVLLAREKSLADLDANNYECNSISYHTVDCFFVEANKIDDANQKCQKMKYFRKNVKWIWNFTKFDSYVHGNKIL